MKFSSIFLLAAMALANPLYAQVENADAVRTLSDSAKVLESEHNYSGAINLYRKIINEFSNTEDFKIQLAKVLGWNGEYDSSIGMYQDVLRTNPSLFDAMFGLAAVTSWKGDFASSLRIYKRLLANHPANVEVLVAISRVSLWSGQNDSAITYSEKALSFDPQQKDALLIISQAFAKELNFKSSRSYLTRLLEVDPENETGVKLLRSIEDEYLNKAAVSFYNENFGPSNKYSNTIISIRYDKRVSYSAQFFGEIDSRRIFGSNDVAGIVGGAYRFSDSFSGTGEFLLGPKSSTAQRERGTVEANYSFLARFTATGTYQYLQFLGNSVNVLSPALTYYFSSENWLLLRAYFGKSNSGNSSASIVARSEFGVARDLRLQLGAFHGAELYRLFSQSILTEKATGGFLSARYRFANNYGLQADFNYTSWNSSPWNWSYAGALSLRYYW
jgi:YaiO family outer membrane protein